MDKAIQSNEKMSVLINIETISHMDHDLNNIKHDPKWIVFAPSATAWDVLPATSTYFFMPDLLIHSPYAESTSQGNTVTAARMERVFCDSGYRVTHSQKEYRGEPADVMVALNARKSAKAIARFRYLHPDSKLIVVLTGTDINHPDAEIESSPTWRSMEISDVLVLLHDASQAAVPQQFQHKCSTIYPSVTLPSKIEHTPRHDDFTIVMAGNMREEKNPELAIKASAKLPDGLKIHVYGEFDEAGSDPIIKHGVVAHGEVLTVMSEAHVLLNTSVHEGGANAICEAITMGLPVIASKIRGNIGMLGDDYLGFFPSGDARALVEILLRSSSDKAFYSTLKSQLVGRAPLFTYAAESKAWSALVSELLSR